jgi:vacuolar-type H+-ATPase subunit B/Vma2
VPRIGRNPIGSFLKFTQEFEKRFVGRRRGRKPWIIETRVIAWQALSLLLLESRTRAGKADLAK